MAIFCNPHCAKPQTYYKFLPHQKNLKQNMKI